MVSSFRNQCDYTKVLVKKTVRVCMYCVCSAIDELPLAERNPAALCGRVSTALRGPKPTQIKMGLTTLQTTTNLTNTVQCTFSSFPLLLSHFLLVILSLSVHSNPSPFLYLSRCLLLTSPHSAAPGSVSPSLGRFFFSHFSRLT